MRIVAVDAAPGKRSTVFDGRDFKNMDARCLKAYLSRIRRQNNEMLLCWDAPLTGPRDADDTGRRGDYTQRPIETFFRRKEGCKTPQGVSVRGYSGCPHWTITRSLLGLPRVGTFDAAYDELPFDLLPNGCSPRNWAHVVAEIHPGVAAWLWCRDERLGDVSWNYKTDEVVRAEMWEIIRSKATGAWKGGPQPKNDDEFDAAMGYILGRGLVEGGDCVVRVMMLGNRQTGSFLLPYSRSLHEKWQHWSSEELANG